MPITFSCPNRDASYSRAERDLGRVVNPAPSPPSWPRLDRITSVCLILGVLAAQASCIDDREKKAEDIAVKEKPSTPTRVPEGLPVIRKQAPARPVPLNPDMLTDSIGITLKLIPAGEFLMGSDDTDKRAFDWEKPKHRVRITQPFYLGTTEVTMGQYRRFVEASGYQADPDALWRSAEEGGLKQTDEHPVVYVSWVDAVAFCAWLSQKEGQTYRLPTEAEWEYCCRAGGSTRYQCGDDAEGLALVGNVADGTAKEKFPALMRTIDAKDGYAFTAPVGRFKANAFGLHDMHGNVWEWCSDWGDSGYYARSPESDPAGPSQPVAGRVIRGGSWGSDPRDCRSAFRGFGSLEPRNYGLGFRVARVRSSQ